MRLKTKSEDIWIAVEGDAADEVANFLVNPLTPKETSEFLEKSTKKEWDKGQRFQDVDLYQYKLLKIKRVIKGWDNTVTDEEDIPIPFNAKSLENVYLLNPELIDKVLAKAEEFSKFVEKKKEGELKNLSTAPTGTGIR